MIRFLKTFKLDKFARGFGKLAARCDLQHAQHRVDIGLLLIVRHHAAEHLQIGRHCALIGLAHAFALGRIRLREGVDNLIHQALHHLRETAIEPAFQIEIDAANEGIGDFAVGKDADLGLDLGVDRILAHLGPLGDARNDGRHEPGADDRIAVLAAEAGKDKPRDIFQEQILDDAIDGDVAQALQRLLAKTGSGETIGDEFVDLGRMILEHGRCETLRKTRQIGARAAIGMKLVIAPDLLDGGIEDGRVRRAALPGLLQIFGQPQDVAEHRRQQAAILVLVPLAREEILQMVKHGGEARAIVAQMGERAGRHGLAGNGR